MNCLASRCLAAAVASWVVGATAAQDAETRFRAELRQQPVQAPTEGGTRIVVHRWPGGPRAPGADVLVVTQAQWTEASSKLYHDGITAAGEDWVVARHHMLSRIGKRWRTDDRGEAVVPGDPFLWGVVWVDGWAFGSHWRQDRIELRPRRRVVVRVTDAAGEPVAGAPVGLFQGASRRLSPLPPPTDAEGRCRIEIEPDAQGYDGLGVGIAWPLPEQVQATFAPEDVPAWPRPALPIELRLPPMARLVVASRHADGRSHPLQFVQAVHAGPDWDERLICAPQPDADGDVTVFAAPHGRLRLWIGCRDQIGSLQTEVVVDVPAGGTQRVAVAEWDAELAVVRVLAADGTPLANRKVVCDYHHPAGHTDAHGRVRIVLQEGRPRRQVALVAFDAAGERPEAAAWIEVPAHDEPEATGCDLGDVRLAPEPLLLRGHVVRADGSPLVGARVERTDLPPENVTTIDGRPIWSRVLWSWPSARSDASGAFALHGLLPAGERIGVNAHSADGALWTTVGLPRGADDVRIVVTAPTTAR
jgi:hypothetical protein